MSAPATKKSAMLVALILSGASFGGALALPEKPVSVNTRPEEITKGRALFVQNCAHCHSEDAGGEGEDGDGPDLHGLTINDTRIKTVIRQGIKGEMPSFAKKLSDTAAMSLVSYLRTLDGREKKAGT